MDHQPYENWLLDDERLTTGQERDLRIHLRNCPECAALSQANMALRAAPMSAPPVGFVLRLQVRLAAQRRAQRLRNIFGVMLILVVGMSVLFLSVPPYLVYLSSSPAQLAATWITNLVYVGVSLQDVSQNSTTLLDVIASFVPSYVWALSFALLGGSGLLWVLSSPTFSKIPQMLEGRKSVAPGDKV
jgi:hypothetical protein